MIPPVPLTEIWRGPQPESVHLGHAVVCDAGGGILEAWGDPQAVILPRSSAKMIQALPLVTAARRMHMGSRPNIWRLPARRTMARRSIPAA